MLKLVMPPRGPFKLSHVIIQCIFIFILRKSAKLIRNALNWTKYEYKTKTCAIKNVIKSSLVENLKSKSYNFIV